ncbi:MAG: hypothetical protein N3E49_08840 [Bacteroidia bacterium]|nr:hypothetical protein [Bacteroidia bacterium]
MDYNPYLRPYCSACLMNTPASQRFAGEADTYQQEAANAPS